MKTSYKVETLITDDVFILLKISVSERLREILKKFAVLNEKEKKVIEYVEPFKRYLIKKFILNSTSQHSALLFSCDLIDNKNAEFKISSVSELQDILYRIRNDVKYIVQNYLNLEVVQNVEIDIKAEVSA